MDKQRGEAWDGFVIVSFSKSQTAAIAAGMAKKAKEKTGTQFVLAPLMLS